MSPRSKNGAFEGPPPGFNSENAAMRSSSPPNPAILIRKLPRNTTHEVLTGMFLFAQDLISIDFVDSKDTGFTTALASFHTAEGAREAQAMLNGKPNTARDANMIVEVLGAPADAVMRRRATLEQSLLNADIKSLAANGTWGAPRFNDPFQSVERISPSTKPGLTDGDSLKQDSATHQGYFSPPSVGASLGLQSNTGKSVIGQDMDDEAGKLLDDTVAYMRNDLQSLNLGGVSQARRSTLPHIPTGRFGSMSVNTSEMSSPPSSGVVSPRVGRLMSPTYSPPNMASMGPNASYQYGSQNFMRHNLPPVNPSDQNPPCNTLYVGNLPMDANEDELKALFCKHRGYKRLCLRTKSNGPMCFVEFEDIQCASKALTECYGMPLHNSTKGGIRLSFSKNPLGVRNGQPGSMNGGSPMPQHGGMSGMNGLPPFSAANGPPPGLNPPPGLGNGVGSSGLNGNAAMSNGFASAALSPIGTAAAQSLRGPATAIGHGWNWSARETRTDLPASMMGR